MKLSLGPFVLVLLGVVLLACENRPLPMTPQAGAPCGIAYVTCTNGGKPTGMCCDENTRCCSGETCPEGMCDFLGDDEWPLARRRPFTLQWQAGTK